MCDVYGVEWQGIAKRMPRWDDGEADVEVEFQEAAVAAAAAAVAATVEDPDDRGTCSYNHRITSTTPR